MRLLEQLSEWKPTEIALNSKHSLCACIEEIWIFLYERGYVELGDITLMQAWLTSLLYAGYKFPTIVSSHVSPSSKLPKKEAFSPIVEKQNDTNKVTTGKSVPQLIFATNITTNMTFLNIKSDSDKKTINLKRKFKS